MNDIEQKALALVREVADGYEDVSVYHVHDTKTLRSALCRAIEQHEAFRQEVSDAVEAYLGHSRPWPDNSLRRFIIPARDLLAEAVAECDNAKWVTEAEYVFCFRAALAKRGLEIREKAE